VWYADTFFAPRAPPCAPPAAQAAPLPDFHLLLEYSDNVFCILDIDGTGVAAVWPRLGTNLPRLRHPLGIALPLR
jgi:hypothetical protein